MNEPASHPAPLYDAHNHLQDPRLDPWRAQILEELPRAGVAAAVVNGTDENDWPAVLKLSQERPWIIPSFGLHPWFIKQRSSNWRDRLCAFLDQPKAVLGEIGLDQWMRDFDLEDQISVFNAQMQIAAERDLPVAIHCLKSWGKLLELLRSGPRPQRGILLHSYGGSAEMILPLAKLGAYFSFSGYFAHERKRKQREIFRQVPIERLLIETDAPDMAPPDEGSFRVLPASQPAGLNDPRNIEAIYDFAADLLAMERRAFRDQILQNFQRLFGKPDSLIT